MRPKASRKASEWESIGDGYDAGEGPLDTGLASESMDLSEILDNAASDGESLSVDAEDLGSHTLRAAVQQDGLEGGGARSALRNDASLLDGRRADEFDELAEASASSEELDEARDLDALDARDQGREMDEDDAEDSDGAEDDALDALDALDARDADAEVDPDSPGESTMEPAAVDLAQNEIRNGSLFDQPRKGEAGQVRRPLVKTNEVDVTIERNQRARRSLSSSRANGARRGKH